MEKKVFINAKLVKSNKSDRKVWMVTTEGWKPAFCRDARAAMKYIFLLKKSTGGYIAKSTIERLSAEIALMRKPVSK